jgi:hypothetical protein
MLGETAPPQQVSLPAEKTTGTVAAAEPEEIETALSAEQPISSETNWPLLLGIGGIGLGSIACISYVALRRKHGL